MIDNPFPAVLLSLTENRSGGHAITSEWWRASAHFSNLESTIKKQTTFEDRKLGTLIQGFGLRLGRVYSLRSKQKSVLYHILTHNRSTHPYYGEF